MKYEYLDHTADAKFRAYGNTINEKFANSALALFNIITDTKKVEPIEKKSFVLKAKRMRSLLYEFLEQFLVYIDEEGWLLSNVESVNVDEEKLEVRAVVIGSSRDYEIKTQVKSITYNDMELKKDYFQVVVDI